MNRSLRIVQIIIWSVIAVFATGILVWCISRGEYIAFDFFGEDNDTNLTEIQSEAYRDDINNIDIKWTRGNVEIFKSATSETKAIQKSAHGTIKNTMIVEVKGDKIVIDQNSQRRFLFFDLGSFSQKTHLELYLPEKEYNSVKIENVSGDIKCGEISSKMLDISIVSGDVYLDGKAQEAHFGNVSGSFRINNLTCPKVNIETVSGDAYLSGTFDDITMESVSGNITVTSSDMISRLRSNAVSGDLTLNIPDNDGFELSFEKLSGSFNTDFMLKTSGNTYTYKDGSAKFNCEVVSGNLAIQQNE